MSPGLAVNSARVDNEIVNNRANGGLASQCGLYYVLYIPKSDILRNCLRDESGLDERDSLLLQRLVPNLELQSQLRRILYDRGQFSPHDSQATHLIYVRSSASRSARKALDKPGQLPHNVNALKPLAEGASELGLCRLPVDGSLPVVADRGRLWPVDLFVLLRLGVLGDIVGAGKDDLVVGRDAANVDGGSRVRGRGRVLHHQRSVVRRLEVDKVPARGCTMNENRIFAMMCVGTYRSGAASCLAAHG
jgi:hypothetical protein